MKKKHYTLKNYKLDESVGFLLKLASIKIDRSIASELKKKCPETTVPQWGILMLVGNDKCKSAGELADTLDCDMGSITRTLDRLEAKGLVKRERSKSDRRIIDLSLTEAGANLLPHLPEVSVNALNGLLGGFTKDEIEKLKGFLRRILA